MWGQDNNGYLGGELTTVQPERVVDELDVETLRPDLVDGSPITVPSKHAGIIRLDHHVYPNLPRVVRFSVVDYGSPWPYWSFYDDETGDVLLTAGSWMIKKAELIITGRHTDGEVTDDLRPL